MDDNDYIEAARQAQADLDELEAAGIEPGALEEIVRSQSDDHYDGLEVEEGAALKAELDALDPADRAALAELSQQDRVTLREAARG
jgi:hypothetical protein